MTTLIILLAFAPLALWLLMDVDCEVAPEPKPANRSPNRKRA